MKEAKPPIGLMPKNIHDHKRHHDVCSAIVRYYEAGLKIPMKWVEEYNLYIDNYQSKGEKP